MGLKQALDFNTYSIFQVLFKYVQLKIFLDEKYFMLKQTESKPCFSSWEGYGFEDDFFNNFFNFAHLNRNLSEIYHHINYK